MIRKQIWIPLLFLVIPTTTRAEPHSKILGNGTEVFWTQPSGKGPFPLLLLIHPHQESPNKIGGAVFAKNGTLQTWADLGYLAVAVSQPGYGNTKGAADFCGPSSQAAAEEALDHFAHDPLVNSKRLYLYGGSRGAVVAAKVAANHPELAGVVLKSGLYDLSAGYDSYTWFNPIKWSMIWELGWLGIHHKLGARSPIHDVDRLKMPMLIIHGTQDDRADLGIAKNFVNKINQQGGKAELMLIESEHVIPMDQIKNPMLDFFNRQKRPR